MDLIQTQQGFLSAVLSKHFYIVDYIIIKSSTQNVLLVPTCTYHAHEMYSGCLFTCLNGAGPVFPLSCILVEYSGQN